MGVSLYTQRYMRAQSVVVLSDAQPYERGHPIYPKEEDDSIYPSKLEVREKPTDQST